MSKLSGTSLIPSLEISIASKKGGVTADAEVLAVFQDASKKPIPPTSQYTALIQKLAKDQVFNARVSGVQFVRYGGKKSVQNVAFLGLGVSKELKEDTFRQAGAAIWNKLVAEKCKTAVINLDTFCCEMPSARVARLVAEGLVLCAYQFTKHKSKQDDAFAGLTKITFLTSDKELEKSLDADFFEVMAMGEAVNVTRDWSNEPSNVGTPIYYATEAKKLASKYGLSCKILTEADCAREKMGLFLAVGQGAERESRFVVVEYKPKGVRNPKTVALVGKGVTFDSGGISIKPALKMEDMKHDMTGAATVMGAMILAAKWEVATRVIGIMAFVENMPDGNAIQPGNVIKTRSGKTVEVNNTDAEGRLILADALDYAQDLKPDAVVNIATLTGAVIVALGKHCCGMMGNDEALMSDVVRAANLSGERVWQLPLYDEYFEDLKSDTADMRNVGDNPAGGTIRGGIFLKQFIRKTTKWAHLDIAATANGMGHVPYLPKKGASGMHVRTLAQLVKDFK